MRRGNVTGEKEKLMHGIADPLTKLSPSITAGSISTEASVRARGEGGGRGGGGGPDYISRVARGSAREAT